jgi:formate hydrogenlyase subunit 6/NADH:ubiquinone oxidoreductase subunit I
MAKIALRNLFTKPATRRYPYVVRESFPGSRGRIVIDYPSCIFCGACSKRCPAASIVVDRPAKLWSIDRFSCVSCGVCVRVCPKKCLSMAADRPKACRASEAAGAVEAHRAEDAPGAEPKSGTGAAGA